MPNDFVCMGDIVSESNSKVKLVLNTSLVWRMQITQLLLVEISIFTDKELDCSIKD